VLLRLASVRNERIRDAETFNSCLQRDSRVVREFSDRGSKASRYGVILKGADNRVLRKLSAKEILIERFSEARVDNGTGDPVLARQGIRRI
jgi:magnesium-transporting ATPase (P-type)